MNTYSQRHQADTTRTWLLRFGAVAGVFFGLAFGVPGFIEAFTGETAGTSFTVGLGVAAFGLPALFGFHLHQADVAGRFGAVAFVVNAIGLGLFAGASFAFNNLLFFVDELRLRRRARWADEVRAAARRAVLRRRVRPLRGVHGALRRDAACCSGGIHRRAADDRRARDA